MTRTENAAWSACIVIVLIVTAWALWRVNQLAQRAADVRRAQIAAPITTADLRAWRSSRSATPSGQ